MTDKPLRWSFVAESGGAQRWYRAALMAEGLRRLGHEAEVWPGSFEHDDHTIRGYNYSTGRWDREPANVIVARLHTVPAAGDLFIRARRAGQIVAFDLDDDVWAFPDWNPGLSDERADPQQRLLNTAAIQVNMACADVCVASTPTLAETMTKVLDTIGEPDVPVAFVRSAVLPSEPGPVDRSPAFVGWLGTWAYRGKDLSLILGPLAEALAGGRGVLRHLGRDRAEPPLPIFLTALDPAGGEPPYVVSEHDWVDIAELPSLLHQLDLAVIPAELHRFNQARSNTTGLALAACGVPFIASPTPEYEHLWEQGCGLVADDDEQWAQLLTELCEDPALRAKLGQRGRDVVTELYSPEVAARHWIEIVEAL